MRFLINWRESGLHRSLKKRYSKIIKGQKRVWIAFGVTDRAAKRFMRPGQKKGGTNEKKRVSSTSGRRLFAGGVCSIRSCASGRNFVPDRDFVPGIPRGLPFCLLYRKAAELLELPHEELPVELIFHHWTETAADYETRDETVIAGVLQALRDVSVESESPIVSTDNRGLHL